jgi:hypothetical protein
MRVRSKLNVSHVKLGGFAAAAGAMVAASLVFGSLAHADDADPSPSSLVENFAYPNAAQVLAQQNVKLITGDGHILIADCATPVQGDIGLLKVYTTDETIGADGIGRVCFRITAAQGLLTLEVPGVYEIRGDGQKTGAGHEVTADVKPDGGNPVSVDVDPDGSTQVGVGADPDNAPTTLLKLTVTG